jgi:hypothetical protein
MACEKIRLGKVWSALTMIALVMVMVVGFSRVALAACGGHTKCGIPQDPGFDCPGEAYDTIGCDEVDLACYAKSCGGGAGCDKGDTCPGSWTADVPRPSGGPTPPPGHTPVWEGWHDAAFGNQTSAS